jgi:cell wall assembly regulator SMI1
MNNTLKISLISFMLVVSMGCVLEDVKEVKSLEQDTKVDLSNAVKISNQLFYIHMGKDNDNCTMYRVYSPTMMTIQGIIYQNGIDKFSMSKNPSTCL